MCKICTLVFRTIMQKAHNAFSFLFISHYSPFSSRFNSLKNNIKYGIAVTALKRSAEACATSTPDKPMRRGSKTIKGMKYTPCRFSERKLACNFFPQACINILTLMIKACKGIVIAWARKPTVPTAMTC